MQVNNILSLFKNYKVVQNILKEAKEDNANIYLSGATTNHTALLASSLFKSNNEFVILVCANQYKANKLYDKLCEVVGYEEINLYAIDDLVAVDAIIINNELKQERLNTLKSIALETPKIIVTHISAVLKKIISYQNLKNNYFEINLKQELDINNFINKLIKFGYKRVPATYNIGEFSLRGEVIDIYPACLDRPIRINLEYDEVCSIKYFDLETQITNSKVLDKIFIMAINEIVLDKSLEEFETSILSIEHSEYIKKDFQDMRETSVYDKLYKYIDYIDNDNMMLVDYLDQSEQKYIVITENISEVYDAYNVFIQESFEYIKDKIPLKKISLNFHKEFYDLYSEERRNLYLGSLKNLSKLKLSSLHELNGFKTVDYQNDFKMLCSDLKASKELTFLCFRTEERLLLIKEVLEMEGIEFNILEDIYNVYDYNINLVLIPNGLSYGIHNFCKVIFEDEIFKKSKVSKARYRSANENTIVINSREELVVGDYVVHYDYGIAKYLGIKTEELNGLTNDYLQLQFDNINILIPVEKITELEKYIGSEGVVPRLTKIGTSEWEKRKKAVKSQLESIARQLIEMQIKRQQTKGHRYQEDSSFQKSFESDFEFEETNDQITIIEDIKKEMEEGVLIDRLICGDVGFGKTEIAMRIAFKTVYEGFQTAYMAPTTILTRQHFHTFKDRFSKYGIKVELLNRLVPLQKQKEVIEGLEKGIVDIVIGTHRLLNDEIKYKNLGLIIVDEEQRFGVGHKEKLKRLKVDVNVLTLTATPIPRTFQMAVTGIRSLSLLQTPPKDRYPIQTYVIEYNDLIIKEAIYREIARGGQVFYLRNKISDLNSTSKKIKKLVPEAKICVGHGRMERSNLEDIVSNFIDGTFNVLICTTIIETGIDIPNSNTLIIEDSHKLGLAQMYQIRGRVGRSDRIAYAYFTYPGGKVLTDAASKRLSAIKELTKIGSGYKIATRDLAIRGAGDILGSEQSGFINSIGIDMYMKLLNEAVNEVQGIEPKEKVNYRIDVCKHVNRQYVDDDTIIVYIHKEINNISSKDDKFNLINELTDRFGKLNKTILDYIEERYLESYLRKYGVGKVLEFPFISIIEFSKEISRDIRGEIILMALYETSERISLEYKDNKYIIKIKKIENDRTWIYVLNAFFENLNKIPK